MNQISAIVLTPLLNFLLNLWGALLSISRLSLQSDNQRQIGSNSTWQVTGNYWQIWQIFTGYL
jgi:hypothetical protein